MTKRILMVVTSHDRLGDTGEKTGLWLEELAAPYWVLSDAGFEVDIASPKGGKAPYDPKSLGDEDDRPSSVARFLADARATAKAEKTLALETIDPARYDAVFLAGGHGTMWDLPENRALASLVGRMFDRNAVVAAVCHGPAGLVSARRADGKPIVAGRKLTSFTNAEEEAVRLTRVVPFSLETKLRELGGIFEGKGLWQAHAVRDGNLITGQNPASSSSVAELIVAALAR
jgi:putative intracellular protease/amidase